MKNNGGTFRALGRTVVTATLLAAMATSSAAETVEVDLKHQRELCGLDNGEACAQLAHHLLKLPDHERYLVEAASAYDKACALKVIWACNNIGDQFFYGKYGRQKDLIRAVGYFQIGCKAKNGYACSRLHEITAEIGGHDDAP